MTQILLHEPHVQAGVNQHRNRKSQTKLRPDAAAMLREIAFILKMTQRVRDEIEADAMPAKSTPK